MKFGFGARACHYEDILSRGAQAPCVEVITENFLDRGGRPRAVLDRLRQETELLVHGVGLSLGGTDPLSNPYLAQLKALVHWAKPEVVSDHICFASVDGSYGHDLWPMPHCEESISHLASRIAQVQETIGRRLAVENVSSYVSFQSSTMTEWEFVGELVRRADCDLLLDVNNVYVSAHNHGFSAAEYLSAIPYERVVQIHLAGHTRENGYLLDNHGAMVSEAVLDLFRAVAMKCPEARVIVEWDEKVPPFEKLLEEVHRVEQSTQVESP